MTCLPPNIQRLEGGAVVDLINVYTQQNILCKNFLTLRIISGGKCAISEREICPKVGKSKI